MIFIDQINKIALSLGPITIYWYGLAYFFGIIIGFFLIKDSDQKYQIFQKNEKLLDQFAIYIIIAVILGGRLGYILFYNPIFYLNHPDEIIKIWHGGMAFHGALIALVISTLIFSRKYKISFFAITDYIAYAASIGIFFGRMANFVNQELLGKPSIQPWAIKVGNDISRHPSQIYEALGEGLLIFLIFIICEIRFNILKIHGLVSGLFLILYGIARFIIEFFREPDPQIGYILQYFTMGQIFCLAMIVSGVIILKYRLKYSLKHKNIEEIK